MSKNLYKVCFVSQGKIYEVYAREVGQSAMYGFIEVGNLQFGERSDLIVDPAEEKIKAEFENVKRIFVPMHAVIRIDEVEKQGISKIKAMEGGSNITPFPVYTPGNDSKKS